MCLWVLSREKRIIFLDRVTHKGQRTSYGNQRGERRPASSPGRRGQRPFVFAGTSEEAIALGMSWLGSTAPKPHEGSSDGDRTIDYLSEVVTWSVLVWFPRQRGIQLCDGLLYY